MGEMESSQITDRSLRNLVVNPRIWEGNGFCGRRLLIPPTQMKVVTCLTHPTLLFLQQFGKPGAGIVNTPPHRPMLSAATPQPPSPVSHSVSPRAILRGTGSSMLQSGYNDLMGADSRGGGAIWKVCL
jgi:hypothetical protein